MLPIWYKKYKNLIDISIEKYLKKYFKTEKNKGLELIKEASFYATKGGKRIRSILALEFYLIFSEPHPSPLLKGEGIEQLSIKDDIIKFCIAIELLHAYSLIHDDLPAMDNDEYRRGELTVWKKFGETNAILVGDLLNSLAFEVFSEIGNIKLVKLFGEAVNLKGMIGGQVLDLYYEKNSSLLNLENLIEIHNKKTGALIEFSIIGGIILSGYNGNLEKYKDFGQKIGLAFQIKDDLLDVEGNFEETGKSVGGEKKGFVYFLGLNKTKKYLNDLIEESKKIISDLNSEKLDFIINYIQNRKK